MKTEQIIALDRTMTKLKEELLGVWDRNKSLKKHYLKVEFYSDQPKTIKHRIHNETIQ